MKGQVKVLTQQKHELEAELKKANQKKQMYAEKCMQYEEEQREVKQLQSQHELDTQKMQAIIEEKNEIIIKLSKELYDVKERVTALLGARRTCIHAYPPYPRMFNLQGGCGAYHPCRRTGRFDHDIASQPTCSCVCRGQTALPIQY